MTIGRTAKGPQVLYIGHDAGKAKEVYTAAINGAFPEVHHVSLFLRPSPDRRHDVVKAEPAAAVEQTIPEQSAKAEEPAPVEKPKASRKAK